MPKGDALGGFEQLILPALARLGDDAGTIGSTVEINKPPTEVWKWIEEADKFKKWVSWVVDVKDDSHRGVGGKRQTMMKDPNMDGQLVAIDSALREYNPPRNMAGAAD